MQLCVRYACMHNVLSDRLNSMQMWIQVHSSARLPNYIYIVRVYLLYGCLASVYFWYVSQQIDSCWTLRQTDKPRYATEMREPYAITFTTQSQRFCFFFSACYSALISTILLGCLAGSFFILIVWKSVAAFSDGWATFCGSFGLLLCLPFEQ